MHKLSLLKISLPVLLMMLHFNQTAAQYQDTVNQTSKAIDSMLMLEQLDTLGGLPQTFYSKGYTTRAFALQKLVSESIGFYEQKFPARTFHVPLYILNSRDWNERLFAAPYSLPNYLPANNIIITGAEKNALAKLTGQPLTNVADSIVSGYDYIAVHELGHYFFITLYGIRTGKKWVDEFLANYFLVVFMQEKKQDIAKEWQKIVRGNDNNSPAHRRLEDFEKLYDQVGPPNYDWYQKKFMKLGLLLYPQWKAALIAEVLANYAPGGKKTDPDALMKALAPAIMDRWYKEMQ